MSTLKALLKPDMMGVAVLGPRKARIILEPLERGFGHTLGNALRRVLLSSMPGCAVVEAKIEGVLHEYTAKEGVQEDITEVLLNLKEVEFLVEGRDEVHLTLHKKGEGKVVAGDFELPADVRIINPEHVIAHLSKTGELEMTVKVIRGRGYEPVLQRIISDEETAPIGWLKLDASFSPVRRVT